MARFLNARELEQLSGTWLIWAAKASSAHRAVSRARLYLFFLLARFGGMRSSEISSLDPHASIDLQTGLLRIKNRRLFLPPAAMRPLRRILSLPDSRDENFLKLDSGFLRKTFYAVASLAALPQDLCAPRALRYARAMELIEMHMPPRLVAQYLDLGNQLHLACLHGHKKARPNEFAAILTGIETGYRSGRLVFETAFASPLVAILPLEDLASLEAECGDALQIYVPPGLVQLARAPLPAANRLPCELLSVDRDQVEASLKLRLEGGIELLAVMDSSIFEQNDFKPGDRLLAHVPTHAIQLRKPD